MFARVRYILRRENQPSPVVVAIVLNLIVVFGIAGATTCGYNAKRTVAALCKKIEASGQFLRQALALE
jgi:hypothetical protein